MTEEKQRLEGSQDLSLCRQASWLLATKGGSYAKRRRLLLRLRRLLSAFPADRGQRWHQSALTAWRLRQELVGPTLDLCARRLRHWRAPRPWALVCASRTGRRHRDRPWPGDGESAGLTPQAVRRPHTGQATRAGRFGARLQSDRRQSDLHLEATQPRQPTRDRVGLRVDTRL